MMDPFRYPRTPRSRSLKPLVFPDLLGKAQDGQNHPQARKRRKVRGEKPKKQLATSCPVMSSVISEVVLLLLLLLTSLSAALKASLRSICGAMFEMF